MKSIQNQYNQLIEGSISQANFMRNVRMTFPHLVSNVTNFEDSVKILRNKGLLSEAKKDEGHLCNPVEVDLGLKVEVAKHEGDVEKAKKTVYANLKKNSSYYSQLNLGGQAVEPEKIKAKKSKKKHSDIDTENGMKKVKEIVKENLDEVGLNMMGDEQPNAAVKQAAQFIDLNNQLKPFSGEITLQNGMDNRAILKYGYWESLPEGVLEKLALQFDIETDVEDHGNEKLPTVAYILSPKASQINRNIDLGSAFEKFKASLEEIVREVIEEEDLNEAEESLPQYATKIATQHNLMLVQQPLGKAQLFSMYQKEKGSFGNKSGVITYEPSSKVVNVLSSDEKIPQAVYTQFKTDRGGNDQGFETKTFAEKDAQIAYFKNFQIAG
jgi:hypothetical protein